MQNLQNLLLWFFSFSIFITLGIASTTTNASTHNNVIPSEPFLLDIEGSGALRIQNISGAATNDEAIVLIDDGGAALPHSIFLER